MREDAEKVLIGAKSIISHGWTQGREARDRNGLTEDFSSFAACNFCAIGAIKRAAIELTEGFGVLSAIAVLKRSIGVEDVAAWNDDPARTLEEVLFGFDKAITNCKAPT